MPNPAQNHRKKCQNTIQIPWKSVIFFDEIQEFKELTIKVKFLVDEGSFRYVFSGSLLGVELKNLRSAPVGYLKTLTMYPMDFEEFLQIYNFTEQLRASLYRSFVDRTPVNETVHGRMMQIYDLILAELNASNKRFNFADIKKGLRHERSEDSFIWLASAGVALPVYNVTAPSEDLK